MNIKQPNILFITTDQQHWDTIPALGNSMIQTPNLDRLVQAGVSFRRAHVTSPVYSRNRSSMMTGGKYVELDNKKSHRKIFGYTCRYCRQVSVLK